MNKSGSNALIGDALIVSATGTELLSSVLPLSPRALRKAIFDAANPEHVARSLPAQALYLLVRDAGVTSSLELLALADEEQFRTMLDLDLWRADELNEDCVWEWLALVEEQDDFSVLQKVLKTIDLKLVGMILASYVEVIIFDDGNDQPPHAGFYTPDKGFTWLHVNIQDPDKHFLLTRFLALIFETSRELFYQLLSISSVSTRTSLEEDSYQERNKRLEAYGVPNTEFAHELFAALPVAELNKKLADEALPFDLRVFDIRPVPILHHSVSSLEPLDAVFRAALSGVEEEFTLLANAMLVLFKIDFSDRDAVERLTKQLLGAINLGLERGVEGHPSTDAIELVKRVGLRPFAQCGMTLLLSLRKKALNLSAEQIKQIDPQTGEFLVIAGAREYPPLIPDAWQSNGSFEIINGRIERDYRAFQHSSEYTSVFAFIEAELLKPELLKPELLKP